MTRRNSGRSVYEIKEVEKSLLQHHPLPEEYEYESDFTRTYRIASAPYGISGGLPSSSYGRISPISVVSYCSEAETPAQSCGTSRSLSSASSWTDDGYEQETSEKVQKIFDSIDSLLYEGIELPQECKEVQEECLYWRQAYPHLRVNARPIVKDSEGPSDDIVTAIPTACAAPSHGNRSRSAVIREEIDRIGSGRSIDTLGLVIHGIKLEPLPVPIADEQYMNDEQYVNEHPFNSVFEEILAQDGQYEELIAVDYGDATQPSNSDQCTVDNGPENSLHQQILNRVIEHTWQKVVQQLAKVLAHRIRNTVLEDVSVNTRRPVDIHEGPLVTELPIARFPTAPLSSQNTGNLHGLLTISSKTLLSRSSDRSVRCVTQASAPAAMVGSRLTSPQKGISRSGRGRLAPLDKSAKCSTQVNISNISHNDSLMTQPLLIHPLSPPSWGRHFPLPPIESGLHQSPSPLPHIIQRTGTVKQPSSAVLRTYSDPGSKKAPLRESSKARLTSSNRTVTIAQGPSSAFRTTRLLSAVDDVRRYSSSNVTSNDRIKSGNRINESLRIQSGTLNRYGFAPTERISTGNGTRAAVHERPHQNANNLFNNSHLERRTNR